MEINKLIAVDEFRANHDIKISFIHLLQKYGQIEITTIEKTKYFNAEQLQQMGQYIRFYYELNIHPHGIDSTIMHLLLHVRNSYCLSDHLKYMN